MWDPYSEFETAILPNGLTVHAAEWRGRPWEAVGFVIHSGAEQDPVGLEGLAHFVEHLVSNNTIIPKAEIKSFFKDSGGWVELGSTGYFNTRYKFFIPIVKPILENSFSVFGHMLLSAKLNDFVENERSVIVQEFHERYQTEFKLEIDTRRHKSLYSGLWLERFVSPFGNLKSIEEITQAQLQSYYDEHYTPANISIVGVGGMKLGELVEYISESPFSKEKKGSRNPIPSPMTKVTPPLENRCTYESSKFFKTPVNVASFDSTAKIPGNISFHAVMILKEMLNLMLYEEIRGKHGWNYSSSISLGDYRHFLIFSISSGVIKPENIEEVERIIESCITLAGEKENLFDQTKRQSLARNLILDKKGSEVTESSLTDLSSYQRIISISEINRDIEKLTFSNIKDILKWLTPEFRWTLIIKP
jgi:predicted Zn-dependent peptidase